MQTAEKLETAEAPTWELSSYSKVTPLQRLALGAGGIPDLGMQYAIMQMANPIFNVGMGVSPVLIGVAMSLPRFWEMIIDPWIGSLSDRTHTPLGRRHPFILTGGILGGLIFAAVWWVPASWSVDAKGIWLLVLALLHFTAYSIFMVPYSALLAEVSHVPAERTRIMATRTAFTAICSCSIGWMYWLCQRPGLGGTVHGMRAIGMAFAALMAIAAILPTLVCKRSRQFIPRREPERRETYVIREIFGIRDFRFIIIAVFALLGSFTLISNLGFYLNSYYVFRGNPSSVAVLQGVTGIVVCAASIGTCSMVSWISRQLGQPQTMMLFLCLSLAGKLSLWWTMRPENPYASIVSIVLVNMGVTAFWIFMPSLIGEISNRHERETGRSLYGSFCAFYGVTMKVSTSVALLFTGFVLTMAHFNAARGWNQPAATITTLRLLSVVVPSAGIILVMCVLRGVWGKDRKDDGSP